jgi:hypothetical protein
MALLDDQRSTRRSFSPKKYIDAALRKSERSGGHRDLPAARHEAPSKRYRMARLKRTNEPQRARIAALLDLRPGAFGEKADRS